MRIAIVGAGAMGSLYAGLLAQSGADVWLVGRSPASVDAIRAGGLRMTMASLVDVRVPLRATTDPRDVGLTDAVLYLTKTYDMPVAAAASAPLFGPATLAVSLQNGIGAPDAILAQLGEVAVAAGVSEVGGEMMAPGHLEMTANIAHGSGLTTIGSYAGSAPRGRLDELAHILSSARLPTVVRDDIDAFIWTKLALAGTMSSISALTRLRIDANMSEPDGWAAVVCMIGEIVAVGRAKGIAIESEAVLARARATYSSVPRHVPSMAADLRAGRRTEVDALSGAVVAEAARHGVDVPMCTMVTHLIRLIEANPGQSIW